MKITDGKKTLEIKMYTFNNITHTKSNDLSADFFEAGMLKTAENGAKCVDDVEYCIEYARDWANKTGDFSDGSTFWWDADDEDCERIVVGSFL